MKTLASILVGSCMIVTLSVSPIFSLLAMGQAPECVENIDCDDNNLCTDDFCVDGFCQSFSLGCFSTDPCDNPVCNPATGFCEANPRPDGTSCGFAAECRDGTCGSTLCNCSDPDALSEADGFELFGKTYILGSPEDDIICGTFDDDVIIAWGGNDCVDSRAGDDKVFAGPGDDMVDGGEDFDKIVGGRGEDVCIGGEHIFACEFDMIVCGPAVCPEGFFCFNEAAGLCCRTDGGGTQCVLAP